MASLNGSESSNSTYTYTKRGEQITVTFGEGASRFKKLDRIDTGLNLLSGLLVVAALAGTIAVIVFVVKKHNAEIDAKNVQSKTPWYDLNNPEVARNWWVTDDYNLFQAHLANARYFDSMMKGIGYSSAAAVGLAALCQGTSKIMHKTVLPPILFPSWKKLSTGPFFEMSCDELRSKAMPRMYAAGEGYMNSAVLDILQDTLQERDKRVKDLKDEQVQLQVNKPQNIKRLTEINDELEGLEYVPQSVLNKAQRQNTVAKSNN